MPGIEGCAAFVLDGEGQGLDQAMIAEPGIEHGQVLQPDAFAAERERQAGVVQAGLRPHQMHAGAVQPGFESVRADAVQHRHRRHVQ